MAHTANLLGALALGLSDRIAEVLESHLGAGNAAPAALLAIGTRPEQNILSLKQTLGLSHSAAVRVVDGLQSAGLVARGTGEDRRSRALRLSSRGRRVFSRLLAERRRLLVDLISSLDKHQRDELHKLLETLLRQLPENLEQARHLCRLCEHGICHGESCPVGSAVHETT